MQLRVPADLQRLARGLELLYKADPFVEIESSKEGEHIVCAAGMDEQASSSLGSANTEMQCPDEDPGTHFNTIPPTQR